MRCHVPRFAVIAAVMVVAWTAAFSEDIDVQSLQTKLAAQQARLVDLRAKMNSGAYASGGKVEGLLETNRSAVSGLGIDLVYRGARLYFVWPTIPPETIEASGLNSRFENRGKTLFGSNSKEKPHIEAIGTPTHGEATEETAPAIKTLPLGF